MMLMSDVHQTATVSHLVEIDATYGFVTNFALNAPLRYH